MITIVYRLILVAVIGLLIRELFEQDDAKTQATIAMVLVPFIMRALMVA